MSFGGMSWVSFGGISRGSFGGISWVSFGGMSWVSFGGMSWVSFGECPGCLLGNVLGGESPCLEILPFWGISSWLFIIQIVIVVAFFNAPNWYVKNACSNLFLFFYAGHNGNLI